MAQTMQHALVERAERPWDDDERKDRDRDGDDRMGGDCTLKAEHQRRARVTSQCLGLRQRRAGRTVFHEADQRRCKLVPERLKGRVRPRRQEGLGHAVPQGKADVADQGPQREDELQELVPYSWEVDVFDRFGRHVRVTLVRR